jgi:hypothetical protein
MMVILPGISMQLISQEFTRRIVIPPQITSSWMLIQSGKIKMRGKSSER